MGVPKQSITYFNFSGGLNSDASPLNLPPNDATDLLNIDISRDGSVAPRRPIDFITPKTSDSTFYENYTSPLADTAQYNDPCVSATTWDVQTNSKTRQKFMVEIIYNKAYIWRLTNIYALAELDTPTYTVDLSSYCDVDVAPFHKTRFIQSRNRLYILNEHRELGYLAFSTTINGMLFVKEVPYTRSLKADAPIESYVNLNGKLYQCIRNHTVAVSSAKVEKTEITYYGDDLSSSTSRTYTVEEEVPGTLGQPGIDTDWSQYWVLVGTADTANYPTWSGSGTTYRTSITTVYELEYNSLDTTFQFGRFTAGCLATGRLLLAGMEAKPNTVYFSQTITENYNHNRFYQFADPLNKLDSDIVDTDGGSVEITEANNILALASFQDGFIVFADNGVWHVRGNNGVFKPNDFTIDKVSDEGIVGQDAWAYVENTLVYFGVSGVFLLQREDFGLVKSTPITNKISTYYGSDIPLLSKQIGKAIYNSADLKLYYYTNLTIYDWVVDANQYKQNTHFRDALVFDLRTQSWSISNLIADSAGTKVALGDVFNIEGSLEDPEEVITDNDGVIVTDELLVNVTALNVESKSSQLITSAVFIKQGADAGGFYTTDIGIGVTKGTGLTDFSLNSTDEESYDAYILTAYQLFGDAGHMKQTPYIYTLFDRVETGVIDDDTGEDIVPGGCLMSVNFSWAVNSNAQKFGTARQVYKPTRWTTSYMDGRDSGYTVVKGKHKVRGRGSCVQVKFQRDGDKDFKLYGFQIEITISKFV